MHVFAYLVIHVLVVMIQPCDACVMHNTMYVLGVEGTSHSHRTVGSPPFTLSYGEQSLLDNHLFHARGRDRHINIGASRHRPDQERLKSGSDNLEIQMRGKSYTGDEGNLLLVGRPIAGCWKCCDQLPHSRAR